MSNVTPNISRSSDSFSTVPSIVNGIDTGCIVRNLETIIVFALIAFYFIPQRSQVARLQGCKIESRLWLSYTDLYHARGTQRVLPMRRGGATSQLYLPSLTPLSLDGCGRLKLRVFHWDTSVDYFK